ncbi:MAG: glycosyl transferase [Acidobacteria bacterium]|nr:glycosyl transferase [Acidobacteriota bacterium]
MTLLYFSPVPWDSYPQRPHSFVRHFLQDQRRRAIWIDPYPSRLPRVADLTRSRGTLLPTPRPANLQVLALRALPVEPIPLVGAWHTRLLYRSFRARLRALVSRGTRLGVVVGRPSGLAHVVLQRGEFAWSAYDAMDDFPMFYRGLSRQCAARMEWAIAGSVDVILTSSTRLSNKFSPFGDKRVLVRNAFEMSALPPVQADERRPIVFGYVGCVGSWFDWSIVDRLAAAHPAAPVRIIGPRVTTPRGLRPNVELVGACSHEATIQHMERFSVGLIPFTPSPLTESVDPIKYYAYRAMGLPVVTTRFGEMRSRGAGDLTFFVEDHGIEATAAAALRAPVDAAETIRFRQAHDWRCRFADAGLFRRILPA